MVPTALKWSYGVKLMVTTHFDLISGPLRVPRGPKGVIWAQSLNFHVTIFWGILFVSNIVLVTTHFDLISGPLRVPRGPKGVILAQSLNFHVPIFWGILFVSNIGLWGVQSVAAECLDYSALL